MHINFVFIHLIIRRVMQPPTENHGIRSAFGTRVSDHFEWNAFESLDRLSEQVNAEGKEREREKII